MEMLKNDYLQTVLNGTMDRIDQIRAFVATAQTGSFTAAAGLGTGGALDRVRLTALDLASAAGHSEVCEMLFKAGAKTRAQLAKDDATAWLAATGSAMI